ncbi:hypothetical protein K7G98_19175 [Saccharothrix sp. MB29]|nr:hypothetical protein [Saccharothrix sp. MB29]
MMPKYVYDFAEGNRSMADLLGGKGANLAEMTVMGLPVPPGFTITTEACRAYLATGTAPEGLAAEVGEHLHALERAMGRKLGQVDEPLLVAVRSGARFSMPGMMDTVLDIGLTDDSVAGLAAWSGDERLAWDSYRRLVQMFGTTVLGVDAEHFAGALREAKRAKGVTGDLDLDAADLRELTATFKDVVREHAGREFPQDPREQLDMAIASVFESWRTERARVYRHAEHIPEDLGTAEDLVEPLRRHLRAAGLEGTPVPDVPRLPSVDATVRTESVRAKPDPEADPLPVDRRVPPPTTDLALDPVVASAAEIASEARRHGALALALATRAAELDAARRDLDALARPSRAHHARGDARRESRRAGRERAGWRPVGAWCAASPLATAPTAPSSADDGRRASAPSPASAPGGPW